MDARQHKARLRHYFDGVGFERWAAIYGEGQLSSVRRSIRAGHSAMLETACRWIDEEPPVAPLTALDAGCGTGLFSLALGQRGYSLTAADIAPQMVAATEQKLRAAGISEIELRVSDLEELSGRYTLVACFDVLIHYPAAPFATMLSHLAGLCADRLLFTYAPYSPLLAALHRVGGFFPHSQRRTDIQMIREDHVRSTLAQVGMSLRRSQRVSNGFYHVTLVEAGRD